MTPKLDVSIEHLRDRILECSLPNAILFPDTGFVTTELPPHFWRAAAARSLAFPQMTVAELSGWLRSPLNNGYLHSWLPRALAECAAAPLPAGQFCRAARVLGSLGTDLRRFTVAIADRSELRPLGYDYYVNILSLRKRVGIAAHRNLASALGRDPSDEEFRRHLTDSYHERLVPLAFKGWRDRDKRNYLADEELVVTAALTAIMTGRETLILTRDTDVFEQFAKLMELFVADYSAWRFGLVHHHNSAGCPMFPLSTPADDPLFEGGTIHHVVVPYDEAQQLPPYKPTHVVAYCFLIGNNSYDPKISMASFCLEREMAQLLDAKGKTNGMNTPYFPGRDMYVSMKPDADKLQVMFTLGAHRRVSYEGADTTRLDVLRALNSKPLLLMNYYLETPLIFPHS